MWNKIFRKKDRNPDSLPIVKTVSGQVGRGSTPVDLVATLPPDAGEVTVRLIPLDRSIAAQEVGAAIFERVSLTGLRDGR